MSGRDPGELGIYGFRNRSRHDYGSLRVADSRAVEWDRVWDQLLPGRSPRGRRRRAADLTADGGQRRARLLLPHRRHAHRRDYTYPAALRAESSTPLVGTYRVDVRNFRSDDRDRILAEIYEMTEQRFAVCRHLLDTRPVGLLHDGRDRARPDAPRLLAATSIRTIPATSRITATATPSATTTSTSTKRSASCSNASTTTRR